MPRVDDMMEYAQHVSGIGRQFAHPRGILGQLAGYLLARTATARSLWVLSQLNLQPDDRVLEVGFGPGMDVQRVSAITVDGFVAGIDASAVMVRQAHKRNAAAIRAGKVELRPTSMDEPLPYPDASFTKVFSINSFPFWRNQGAALREAHRALRPGGVIAIAVQPVMRGATAELVRSTGEWLAGHLEESGFRNVSTRVGPTKPMGTACALGRK
jgi:ubiquinone/menaquinone biosynthesis C-methylase UbiE